MGFKAEDGVVGVVITLLTSAIVLLNILLILLCALTMLRIKEFIDNRNKEDERMEEDVDFITLLTGVKNGSFPAGTYRCVDDADIVVNVDGNGFGIEEKSEVTIVVLFDEKFTRTEDE